MQLEPIEYQGELVALAGPERFHIVAPWLLGRSRGDQEVRFVAFMCLCRRQAARDGVTGHVPSEVLEAWTRRALIDEGELQAHLDLPDVELARRLNVPAEQVAAARAETWGCPIADLDTQNRHPKP